MTTTNTEHLHLVLWLDDSFAPPSAGIDGSSYLNAYESSEIIYAAETFDEGVEALRRLSDDLVSTLRSHKGAISVSFYLDHDLADKGVDGGRERTGADFVACIEATFMGNPEVVEAIKARAEDVYISVVSMSSNPTMRGYARALADNLGSTLRVEAADMSYTGPEIRSIARPLSRGNA
jgi:hypothetical protein